MTTVYAILGLAIISLAYVGWSLKKKKRRLSGSDKKEIEKLWKSVESVEDPVRKLTEADAVLEKALGKLGFEGSMADKLKKAGPRFPHIQAIWEAHKLRNRLVHEPGGKMNAKNVDRAVRAFGKAIDKLT
ncbi:MAG: hypothetical protein QF809_00565 [Candidatus Peribacteraceae bacterium]|jgi:hypothetical protein|nr:hypothetical protein [Candidatus Peribacteraceae bacterium]MDP7645978.1 hypothetical protein [Candidatus Peribacteraceae bacterium]